MASPKESGGGGYKVGYGKPPAEHQFRKGKSGNPSGRPKKRKPQPVDVGAVLNEPIAIKQSGTCKKMQPFEVSIRKLVERGLKKGDLSAILEFLVICETYEIIAPPPIDTGSGIVLAPKGVSIQKWLESVTELVPKSTLDDDEFD